MKHKPSKDDNEFLFSRCENISDSDITEVIKADGETYNDFMESLKKFCDDVKKNTRREKILCRLMCTYMTIFSIVKEKNYYIVFFKTETNRTTVVS